MNLTRWVFYSRHVHAPPVAEQQLRTLPGCSQVFEKGTSSAGHSHCAVNLGIWLKPAKDGKLRANPLTFISMSSFMLPHKISQFSGTCTAMKVGPCAFVGRVELVFEGEQSPQETPGHCSALSEFCDLFNIIQTK